MRKTNKSVWVIFFILILSNILVIVVTRPTKASTATDEIFVDDNSYLYRLGTAEYPYGHINDAIVAANEGDTIYVFGGYYNETLNINKRVTLIGSIEEGDSIITYNTDHKYTIEITADFVNISGFYIHDSNDKIISEIGGALIHVTSSNVIINNNNITNCTNGWGIYLDKSANQLIKSNNLSNMIIGVYALSSDTNDFVGNNISNCSSYGIEVESSHHNTLFNNTLDSNYYGIYIKNSDNINISNNTITNNNNRGISLYSGSENTVAYNFIYKNSDQGLYVGTSNSNVYGNVFKSNQIGIKIYTSNCNIYSNFINDSSSKGINTISGTRNNIIYLNHFNRNEINAYEQGSNKWYNENLMEGNYWDDYLDVDRNYDGIGDVAYQKNGVYDLYPAGIFLRPPNKPTLPSPKDGQDNVGLKITLSVNVTDPNGYLLDVYFYRTFNGSTPDVLVGSSTNLPNRSTATCSFNLPYDSTVAWYTIVNNSKLENQSNIYFFSTKNRPASNIAPVAVAEGPANTLIGESVTFNSSSSSDQDGFIEFYRWNFGDDTSEILSASPTHVYYSSGTYNVTLTVIDNNGTSSSKMIKINVTSASENIAPVADAGGPYSGYVNSQINFIGSASHDLDGTIASYYWIFGDGSSSKESNPKYTYTKAGNYVATLTVTDNQGKIGSSSASVTINSKTSSQSPGFELILIFAAIIILIFVLRRKNKL